MPTLLIGMTFVAADPGAVIYGVSLFMVLIVIPVTVTWLKGQRALVFAGFLTVGFVWFIAAFRLARPNSWWARRFYDPRKQARATARYGG